MEPVFVGKKIYITLCRYIVIGICGVVLKEISNIIIYFALKELDGLH